MQSPHHDRFINEYEHPMSPNGISKYFGGMQDTGISNVMEQSHEDSEFERKPSTEMLSINMKATDMFDSHKRLNDSKLSASVPQEFKRSIQGPFIPEEQNEETDSQYTTITKAVKD